MGLKVEFCYESVVNFDHTNLTSNDTVSDKIEIFSLKKQALHVVVVA